MSIDATEWLNAHGFGPSWKDGPKRPVAVPEDMEPGDVMDDGAIPTASGMIVLGGVGCIVWLSEDKARAATYYGRQPASSCAAVKCGTTGEWLFPMCRPFPC